jgi:hypothetical protein
MCLLFIAPETLVNLLSNLQALFVTHGRGKDLNGAWRPFELLKVI